LLIKFGLYLTYYNPDKNYQRFVASAFIPVLADKKNSTYFEFYLMKTCLWIKTMRNLVVRKRYSIFIFLRQFYW